MSSLQCSKPPRRKPPAQQALFISRWISSSLTFACRSLWIPCRGQTIKPCPGDFRLHICRVGAFHLGSSPAGKKV